MTRKPTCTLDIKCTYPQKEGYWLVGVETFKVAIPKTHRLKRRTTPEGIVFSVVKKEGK